MFGQYRTSFMKLTALFFMEKKESFDLESATLVDVIPVPP